MTLLAARPVTTTAALPLLGRRRELLTWALGLLWLLDAALQLQPYMFTSAFPNEVIVPAGDGSPGWVQAPVSWAGHLLGHHIVALNALSALGQLALAVGILVHRTRHLALGASIAWAVLVWWLGEGLGGILAGPVTPLAGLPGAVIIYALIAVLVWPRADAPDGPPVGSSVAASSPLGVAGARAVWLALWGLFAFETLRPANRSSAALRDYVSGMADGEPAWIRSINHATAAVLGHVGSTVALLLGAVFVLLAVSVYRESLRRPALVIGVWTLLLIWVTAQDFGEIATGQSTDPNSALPLILLLACYWPLGNARSRARVANG